MADPAPSQLIALPPGGGAVRGLGETFQPDLHTGTGTLTIPLAVPPGRNGLQPNLSLAYSTGNGNGEFGLGWQLAVPGVARRTARGVPTYRAGADTFVLSGTEDLVPVAQLADGALQYRPRTEGLFAWIVHRTAEGDVWEVTGKDGTTARYGTRRPAGAAPDWRDPAALTDPDHPDRVFAWSLTRTWDLVGNAVEFGYAPDEGELDGHRWRRPSLRSIRYVDFTEPDGTVRFLATVEFGYESRPDPFSSYRSGFEVRTTRRCVSMTTAVHAGGDQPVRRYQFGYTAAPYTGVSLLTSLAVLVPGGDGEPDQPGGLPPVRFGYSRLDPGARTFQPVTGAQLPGTALSAGDHELVDLTGDGLPDLLQLGPVARYWRNLGPDGFDRPRRMPLSPAGRRLTNGGVLLLDAQGDGRADLVVTTGPVAGYHPLRFETPASGNGSRCAGPSWGPLHRYPTVPSVGLKDRTVHLVDLTGDGVTDAVHFGSRATGYFQDPQAGWSGPRPLRFAPGPGDAAPPLTPEDDSRLRWADMSGDGLSDLVLVHDGSVVYWPNLGHGRFGSRRRMTGSPGLPSGYDPRRLLLGDVDGDGLADLVYAGSHQVTVWFNRGGDGWSEPVAVGGVPTGDWDARLADLLGTGVQGVLLSRRDPGAGRPAMFFLDLSGGQRPRLLVEMDNQLGAVTRIGYASSSSYALTDARRATTRWRTPLPFPVPVVARIERVDQISGGKLTSALRYRHGYWDGYEREFRGFALVEQLDTETFEAYHEPGLAGDAFAPVDPAHFGPPTLTRSWFHVGPVETDDEDVWGQLDLRHEFGPGDPPVLAGDAIGGFVGGLTDPQGRPDRPARRDALRALRGQVLRTELFALDGSPRADRPYTVTEHAYTLREEPSLRAPGRPRVFTPLPAAQRITQWERGDDPLTTFWFTDDFDDVGQPTRQTRVAMPRRSARRTAFPTAVGGEVVPDPGAVLASHTITGYAVPPAGLPPRDRVAQVRAYELTDPPGVTEPDPGDPVSILAAQAAVARAVRDTFHAGAAGDLRLVGHEVHHYDGPAFTGLDAGLVGATGLLTRTEALVLTGDLLDEAYGPARPQALGGTEPLPAGAPPDALSHLGYRSTQAGPVYENGWYADHFASAHDVQLPAGTAPARGLVVALRDALGNQTTVTPDPYHWFPAALTDPAGLATSARYDYRHGLPRTVTDPNGTTHTVEYHPLGLLATLRATDRDGAGGTAERPEVRYEYHLGAFADTGQPISVHTRRRVWPASGGAPGAADPDEVIESREYTDGFGRVVQTRTQADELVVPAGPLDPTGAAGHRVADCVVVSGWQVYDNKGRVVETYEPFFSAGWDYQPAAEARQGTRVTRCYDPRGRLVRVLNPDGSQRRTVPGIPTDLTDPDSAEPSPWVSTSYDENDLAPRSTRPDGTSLADAAPAAHHYTPATTVLDALGRLVGKVRRGGPAAVDMSVTRDEYDGRGNLLASYDELDRAALTYRYDLANRPLRVTGIDSGDQYSVVDALGKLVLARDGRGAITVLGYDTSNRPRTVHARDRFGDPLTLRERLHYGDALPPGAERDAAVAARAFGRLWAHDDEAGRIRYEGYDLAGRVTASTRTVVSDSALAAGWVPDWAAPDAEDALEPAGLTTQTSYDALGRTVRLTTPSGQHVVPGYGRSGAVRSVAVDGASYVDAVVLDARGQRTLIAYGNGLMTRHEYDPSTFRLRASRTEAFMSTVDGWTATGPALQDLGYRTDLVGNVAAIQDTAPGCGVAGTAEGRDRLTRTFDYDPLYRLVSATGRACAGEATGRPRGDLPRCGTVPAPTPPGLGVSNQDNAPELTTTYRETYRYDPAGNLVDLWYRPTSGPVGTGWHRLFGYTGGTPGQPDGGTDNRLSSVLEAGNPAVPLDYDAAGNLRIEGGTRHYEWDHAGRLTGFTVQAGAGTSVRVRHVHGADGTLVKTWVRRGDAPATDESTVYLGELAERQRWSAGGGECAVLHVRDGAARVALVRTGDRHPDDAGPAVRYEFGDHLGSASLTVDDAGQWVNREEYFPYGETSFGGFARKRYRYTGMERDPASGLARHGVRWYAPWAGRFVSPDPTGPVDGPNLYRYAQSNPVSSRDRSGAQQEGTPVSAQASSRDPFQNLSRNLNYSQAPEALVKQDLDLDLAAKGIKVSKDNGAYWSALIAATGAQPVTDSGHEVQLYIISGGWEGFLSKQESRGDANRAHWDDRQGTTDLNDALVAFDPKGKFLGAVQLATPNYYPGTRKMMDSEWQGAQVFGGYNSRYHYQGLSVLDSGKLPAFDPKVGHYRYWIDIHHKVATLGCVEVASGSKGVANFDAFVARIGQQYGTHDKVAEQYQRGEGGKYVSLGASEKKLPQANFEVRRNFIGHMHMVSLPTPVCQPAPSGSSVQAPLR